MENYKVRVCCGTIILSENFIVRENCRDKDPKVSHIYIPMLNEIQGREGEHVKAAYFPQWKPLAAHCEKWEPLWWDWRKPELCTHRPAHQQRCGVFIDAQCPSNPPWLPGSHTHLSMSWLPIGTWLYMRVSLTHGLILHTFFYISFKTSKRAQLCSVSGWRREHFGKGCC